MSVSQFIHNAKRFCTCKPLRRQYIILTIFILSLCSCEEAPAKLAPTYKTQITEVDTLVLLYQQEQKGEIWLSGNEAMMLDSFIWKGNAPLGELFSFDGSNLLRKFQGKRTFVLPHALNAKGRLGPCFACRHDKIEAYSTLELLLSDLGFQME